MGGALEDALSEKSDDEEREGNSRKGSNEHVLTIVISIAEGEAI